MFKCEVIDIKFYMNIKETVVRFKVGDKGSPKTPNHKLTGTQFENSLFIIGEIDRSIKVGDLVRCDGLPFTVKPVNTTKRLLKLGDNIPVNSRIVSQDRVRFRANKNTIVTNKDHKFWIYDEIIPGYKPFQLDSGYWVLRKV